MTAVPKATHLLDWASGIHPLDNRQVTKAVAEDNPNANTEMALLDSVNALF